MNTLRVKFPQNWPGWYITEYILTSESQKVSSDNATTRAITLTVDSETHSDYNSDSPVFRGSMEGSNAIFALKFALREDLIPDLVEEAIVYGGVLEPLQGTAVPRCFGLYNGMGEEGQPIACLVLEHWGECLRQPFQKLPITVRIRILEQLGEIHRQGLWHGDFAERNVLQRDGDIRIIDFDQTMEHECDCNMDFRPGAKLPDAEDFGCHQLWEICRSEMGIWDMGS